ncbi:MAG: hypothetical protein J6E41_04620 [Lachnospiraceae bacterium]|nr:hypothetical protein [Lachnospiraceae bacterium]
MNLPLCIVLLYVVLLFAVSFYVSHKQRNNKESLLLYKGQNNTLIVAASVAGLAIGGASTIGISENAFAAGLSAGWYDTAWAIGAVIAGLFVVDRLRRGNYDTISDLIGDLYGSRTTLCRVAEIVLHGEKAIIPASMVLDGEYGEQGLCAGVSVLLGEKGVEEVIEYDLPEEERNQFHQCCDAIRHNMTLDDSVISA